MEELEPSSPEVARLVVDVADDDGAVVVAVAAIVVGSFSIVVADVTAVTGAVTLTIVVVVVEDNDEEEGDDDRCDVAFLVYGDVALVAIGRDAVVAVIAAVLLPGTIGVVFFPLTGSSGRPFDDAGTADTVISSANQTQHWIIRIFDVLSSYFRLRGFEWFSSRFPDIDEVSRYP